MLQGRYRKPKEGTKRHRSNYCWLWFSALSNIVRFADDIDIIAEDESTLERTVHSLRPAGGGLTCAQEPHARNEKN